MDKIDLLISSVVVSVMILCFCLHSHWSYFCAGICATSLFVISIGRIAHSAERRQQENQWKKFIDGIDAAHPVSSAFADSGV